MPSVFSANVAQQLRYYVYLYVNPLDNSVFYVGKGKGNRAFSHLEVADESAKAAMIAEIRAAGIEPGIEILAHGISDEETAFKIEAAVIDLLKPAGLTNKVGGYHSRTHGRMTLEQIRALYDSKPVDITEPSLLVRINQLYRHTLSPAELYDVTRGYWKLGPERNRVQFVMAVYEGVIREVYSVEAWFRAGATFSTRTDAHRFDPTRWEFVGRIADDSVRKKYLYRSVAHCFSNASQNPVKYMPD